MASSIVALMLPLTHPGYLMRSAAPVNSHSKGIRSLTTREITDMFLITRTHFCVIAKGLL